MPDKSDDLNSKQLFDSWDVKEKIGEGSFGIVYRVSKDEMGEQYDSAVKIISIPSKEQLREAESTLGDDQNTLTHYFEDIVKNIIKEIRLLYSLSGNANIVSYQDHKVVKKENEIGWDILIRMEYVTSLRNYLKTNQMTREEIIRLGIDICTALEVCSKKGIIHRDIKDENIFVNVDGVFKLGDFGIARELSKSGRAASMRGTPLYMAPEVYRGDKYDAAVDMYSLGIVLYKLLNHGRMPFMPAFPEPISYQDSEDALEKRMRGEILPLPDQSGEELGKVVLKACAFKADERYSTVDEMKFDLKNILTKMRIKNSSENISLLSADIMENIKTDENLEPKVRIIDKTFSVFDEPEKAPMNGINQTVSVFPESAGYPSVNINRVNSARPVEPIRLSTDSPNSETKVNSNHNKLPVNRKALIIVSIVIVLFSVIILWSWLVNNQQKKMSMANYIVENGILTNYTGSADEVIIPENADIYAIGVQAFLNNKNVSKVIIPDKVTVIDMFAFYGCSNLATITIPESVTTIGEGAFISTKIPTPILINNGKTICYVPNTVQNGYLIPDSVTSINGGAFYGCSSLTEIVIPNSVITIGNSGFASCTNLTTITIPNSVTSIGNHAFEGCEKLTINAFEGSYAHQYAVENSIPFIPLRDDGIYVSSVMELVAAIKPNAVIKLAPGEYNLEELANYSNDYITLNVQGIPEASQTETTHGAMIRQVDNLTIYADNAADVLIFTPANADNVLMLNNCSNISFQNITFGHKANDLRCVGDVIYIFQSTNVVFQQCDLFGCGVKGLSVEKSSIIKLENSTIRDCQNGALWAMDSNNIDLLNTNIYGNGKEVNTELFTFVGASSDIDFRSCAIKNNGYYPLTNMFFCESADAVQIISCIFENNQYLAISDGVPFE